MFFLKVTSFFNDANEQKCTEIVHGQASKITLIMKHIASL